MQKRIATPEIQEFEKEHIAKVRELAPECMVLLKNEGILPLQETGKIALYGSGARRTIKGGTGSGDVNVRHYVNVEEGLEKAGGCGRRESALFCHGKDRSGAGL